MVRNAPNLGLGSHSKLIDIYIIEHLKSIELNTQNNK